MMGQRRVSVVLLLTALNYHLCVADPDNTQKNSPADASEPANEETAALAAAAGGEGGAEGEEGAKVEKSEAQTLYDEAMALRHAVGDKSKPAEALGMLQKAAEMGHVQAAAEVGTMLWMGQGCKADTKRAAQFLQQAADSGNAQAQFALSVLWSWGEGGFEKNEAAAVLHLHFAALTGHTAAEMALGYRHLHGIGVPKSCQDSVSYYTRVADKAVAAVQGQEGASAFVEKKRLSDLAEGGQPLAQIGENEDVLMYYEHSADNGDVAAQTMLGQLYYYGARGVQQNYQQALKYFKKAAEAGDGGAMSNLGHMYAQGLGTEKDNATALKYFKDGVARNNPAAKNGLGYLHMYGIGVPQDYKEANQHFVQAAEGGNPEAQFNLGAMQIAGLGMKRDHSKAVHYFTLAAQQGHIVALYNLGLMHLNGMGTPRSCQVAVQLLKNVAERGPLTSTLSNATAALSQGDTEYALKLYEFSGEVGFEIGQANAAWLLDSHEGLPTGDEEHYGQYSRGLRWYRRSAQQANVPSELRLGDYYYYGLGCDVDMKKAAAHYRTAGELRNPQAMFNMGFMYQLGLGVPQDFHLAKRYYDMAAETSSKAYLPASVALLALLGHGLYSEYAWLVGEDPENAAIVALSTCLVLVMGAIWLRRLLG